MSGRRPGTLAGELPVSELKQQFSLGFVRMVTAAAGFSVKEHATDYDGVDITIVSSGQYKRFVAPQFELQVKCTSQVDLIDPDSVSWRLDEGPFRKLTNPKRFIPAYLGVLVVPKDPESWLVQGGGRLYTESEMYWVTARELGGMADGAASRTVRTLGLARLRTHS